MILEKVKQISIACVLLAVTTSGFTQNKVVVVPLGGDEASGDVLYGRAQSTESLTLLFEWPGTGVEIRTHDDEAGDSIFQVRVVNTNSAGGPSFFISDAVGSAVSLAPGTSRNEGSLFGLNVLLTENNGSFGRMMHLRCFANVVGGGNDGFMNCMGITAGDP